MTDDQEKILPEDKLAFRLIIAKRVDACVSSKDDLCDFSHNVIKLKSCIYFNMGEGLRFKDQIDKKIKELNDWYAGKIAILKRDRYRFYNPIIFHNDIIPYDRDYFEMYFEFLMDLLSSHGFLIDQRSWVEKFSESDELRKMGLH